MACLAQARGSKGGFFQDDRSLSIFTVSTDGWGLPNWIDDGAP